jgi:transcription antitermination factor NusG
LSHWYVVYTKPRWEKKISRLLDDKGIKNYCPLNKIERQWSDRKKIIQEPLFKGYVFVNVLEEEKWSLKNIEGIINFVYWLGKPAKVREDEIERIQKFLQEFKNVEVTENKIIKSDSVIITQGVLMNYKGIVVEIIGNKARVQIDSMGIRLNALFDKKKLITV